MHGEKRGKMRVKLEARGVTYGPVHSLGSVSGLLLPQLLPVVSISSSLPMSMNYAKDRLDCCFLHVIQFISIANSILFLKIALLGRGLVYLLIDSFNLRFLHILSSPVLSDPWLHKL
jgi:hypothetical protein